MDVTDSSGSPARRRPLLPVHSPVPPVHRLSAPWDQTDLVVDRRADGRTMRKGRTVFAYRAVTRRPRNDDPRGLGRLPRVGWRAIPRETIVHIRRVRRSTAGHKSTLDNRTIAFDSRALYTYSCSAAVESPAASRRRSCRDRR